MARRRKLPRIAQAGAFEGLADSLEDGVGSQFGRARRYRPGDRSPGAWRKQGAAHPAVLVKQYPFRSGPGQQAHLAGLAISCSWPVAPISSKPRR